MRKPLYKKIQEAREKVWEAEARLEELETKELRRTCKRREKQHRKKMFKDEMYRMKMTLLRSLERQLFSGK